MIPYEWLMAEVDELACNQARFCSLCRRRARFWPTRPGTLLRAAGRGWSDRCETCVLAPGLFAAVLENRPASAAMRRGVRGHQVEGVLEQIEDISSLPPGAECEQALEMLYLQLQIFAEELYNEEQSLRVISGGKGQRRWVPEELLIARSENPL